MKTLKFRNHQAQMILGGRKNITWRIYDDKDLQVGDELAFIRWETGDQFAAATITRVTEKKLGEISEPDLLGHERFEDMSAMLDHYRELYGDRVTLETPIKVVEF